MLALKTLILTNYKIRTITGDKIPKVEKENPVWRNWWRQKIQTQAKH